MVQQASSIIHPWRHRNRHAAHIRCQGLPLPMPPRHDARGRRGKPCRRRLVAGHTTDEDEARHGGRDAAECGHFDVLAWMTCLTICWSGLYAMSLTATKLRDGRARGGFNVATYTYIYARRLGSTLLYKQPTWSILDVSWSHGYNNLLSSLASPQADTDE